MHQSVGGDVDNFRDRNRRTGPKVWTTATFLPLAQKLRDAAPTKVIADIDIGITGPNRLAETGDFEVAFTPEMDAALDRLHAHDLRECGWQTIVVQAADYAFQGVPNTIEGGETSFEFMNGGTEGPRDGWCSGSTTA